MTEQETPSAWLKAIHYHDDDYTINPGEDTWISDPGRRGANGDHKKRSDGEWWGEPSWQVDDLLGLYFTGTLKVPVLAKVTAKPKFDPSFVRRHGRGKEPDAGERWPWVTRVQGVRNIRELKLAHTLDDLGVDTDVMGRRFKLKLTNDQHQLLLKAFVLHRTPSERTSRLKV